MKLLLALALFGAALPASAQTVDLCCSQRVRGGTDDPGGFVAAIYARYQANPNEPAPDPSIAYSRRLRALFEGYETWSRQHEDLVGALDFDWWTNAQDYSISHLVLEELNEGPDLRWI